MRAVCDYTDFFVLATGKNPRQTHAIHEEVLGRLKTEQRLLPRSTSGLPEAVLREFAPEARLKLPMRPGNRSLNLSNAVAVAVYEAWRQLGFA